LERIACPRGSGGAVVILAFSVTPDSWMRGGTLPGLADGASAMMEENREFCLRQVLREKSASQFW
jgi:hypothetical protein